MNMEVRLNPKRIDWNNPHLARHMEGALFLPGATLKEAENKCRGSLCYLASPYTKRVVIRDEGWDGMASLDRAAEAALWCRSFASVGITVISPVVQAVEMIHADFREWLDPLDEGFWQNWRTPLMRACGPVIIPPIEGWRESEGIWRDVVSALRVNRPVIQIKETEVPKLSPYSDEVPL